LSEQRRQKVVKKEKKLRPEAWFRGSFFGGPPVNRPCRRAMTPDQRVNALFSAVEGRLTYKALTV
jgi:hypothetical protein